MSLLRSTSLFINASLVGHIKMKLTLQLISLAALENGKAHPGQPTGPSSWQIHKKQGWVWKFATIEKFVMVLGLS